MFKTVVNVIVLTASLIQFSGCSTSRALVNYDNLNSDVKATAGSVTGKSLGPVHGDEGGAVWANCTEKATESVRVMLAQAKDMGANAVGDIVWKASNSKTPSCKKGWGYVVIWPFLLTPLFMSTAVEGVAYKTGASGSKAGTFLIPESPEEQLQLARSIVAGL